MTGENISKPGFNNNDWVAATVPGTALVSYGMQALYQILTLAITS